MFGLYASVGIDVTTHISSPVSQSVEPVGCGGAGNCSQGPVRLTPILGSLVYSFPSALAIRVVNAVTQVRRRQPTEVGRCPINESAYLLRLDA